MFNCIKKQAFTLAEVLIVMSIVGIIGAIVLPNLANDVSESQNIAKARKIYSEVETAYGAMISTYGEPSTWQHTDAQIFGNRFVENLEVDVDCLNSNNSICFSSKPSYNIDGTQASSDFQSFLSNAGGRSMLLKDGSAISVIENVGIYVDVDGSKKGKNQFGYDLFRIFFQGNVMHPSQNTPVYDANLVPNTDALAWVIKYGNMDYLRCPAVLKWDTKTSCS